MVRLERKISSEKVREIASARIRILAALAEQVFPEDHKLAQRYTDLAKAISAKSKVRLPRYLRRRICRHCGAYLWPGVNCRVRLRANRNSHITITCLNCKHQMRIHYKRKRK